MLCNSKFYIFYRWEVYISNVSKTRFSDVKEFYVVRFLALVVILRMEEIEHE